MFNNKEDALIGKVLSPHGTGGILKVFPYSDFPERIKLLETVELILDHGRERMYIERAEVYGPFWLIKFRGIETREDAGRYRGSGVVIPQHERISLPEGHYYFDQLVGLMVYDSAGIMLGYIIDIISTGGHDLYQVRLNGIEKRQVFIPAVKKFVRHVDLSAGKVTVDLPEGLLDL